MTNKPPILSVRVNAEGVVAVVSPPTTLYGEICKSEFLQRIQPAIVAFDRAIRETRRECAATR
jgi:hypothetical protein